MLKSQPDLLAVIFYKALWKRAGVILSNEQAAQEMTEAIEPDEDSDVMLATILAAEARAYFAEEIAKWRNAEHATSEAYQHNWKEPQ